MIIVQVKKKINSLKTIVGDFPISEISSFLINKTVINKSIANNGLQMQEHRSLQILRRKYHNRIQKDQLIFWKILSKSSVMRILLSHFFFNFRKSREIILKDILKSSFYIFIKIRWCLILEEFRKYQYKSWIYSKNSRECVCDKCDNILLTEITWANTWRGVLGRAYIPLLHILEQWSGIVNVLSNGHWIRIWCHSNIWRCRLRLL